MDPARLEYLFGPDAQELVDDYDLGSESDRMELVERCLLPGEHEEGGVGVALRSVAVNQILDDDPPETWQAVERMRGAGLPLDRVLSQLSIVIAEQLTQSLDADASFDRDAYVASLADLPLPSRSGIVRAATDVARARQGISIDEHRDALVAALSSSQGEAVVSLVERVLEELIEGPLYWLPDDTTVHVPDLVEGRTFTHRLTDAELELGVLTAGFDLGAFARFDGLQLNDGTELEQFSVERNHLAWRGPDGWLAGFVPDELLAVTVAVAAPDGDDGENGDDGEFVDGIVTIERVDVEPDVSDEAVAAIHAGYAAYGVDVEMPVSGEELAIWLCFHHPELFTRAQPPLAELCDAAGLEQRGGEVAHDESIWLHDLWRQRFSQVVEMVPDSDWTLIIGHALDTLDDPDSSAEEVREALDAGAEPDALNVLADVLFPHGLELADAHELGRSDAPGRLFELVDRATAVARRPREVATAEYLACVLYERCAEPELAEEHLARAIEARPSLGPIVERMGWYRFDRGDARGAMKWWRTLTELPEGADEIEPFLTPAGRKLGRNEPCWCGSGRKYKQCHQNSTELPPLPDRVGWLCRKATLWLQHCRGEQRDLVLELALAWAAGSPVADFADLDGPDQLTAAFEDPIVFDAALTEGGLFSMFLRDRSALLPDDEQLLASTWETVTRSVHEVNAVDAGVGMTVRDLATGDVAEVRERTLSRHAQVGERYCARVVPDGATHQFIGAVFPVRVGHEEAVLDLCAAGDAAGIAAWVGRLHQPPEIVHRPGMSQSLFDTEALDAALADLDDDADDATIRARLGAELARQREAAWVDEHVPALDGLTPREAAADPTRREQVERLLDEFDRMADRLREISDDSLEGFHPGMDTAALRRELGL